MNTIFILYLILLEFSLVLAVWDPPSYPTDCKVSNEGYEYAGSLNVTLSGKTCQRWNSDWPHSHKYKNSLSFPEINEAGNKCRNPDFNYHGGVWCYTTDPNTRWELCDVQFCDVGCKFTKEGRFYTGPLNITRSGRTCQRWDSNWPHDSNFKKSTDFPEGSASAAGNKCRNPDDDYNEGVWCYTTDPNKRWEECALELCGLDCKFTSEGREYAGPRSVTRSGKTCQRWDSFQPHYHSYTSWKLFPEDSVTAAGNKCRNPDDSYTRGVWCYTTDPNTPWEDCDVRLCAFRNLYYRMLYLGFR